MKYWPKANTSTWYTCEDDEDLGHSLVERLKGVSRNGTEHFRNICKAQPHCLFCRQHIKEAGENITFRIVNSNPVGMLQSNRKPQKLVYYRKSTWAFSSFVMIYLHRSLRLQILESEVRRRDVTQPIVR